MATLGKTTITDLSVYNTIHGKVEQADKVTISPGSSDAWRNMLVTAGANDIFSVPNVYANYSLGALKAKTVYITGSASNTTAHITSDTTDNIYFSVKGVIPLVINASSTTNPCVRASNSLKGAVDLGSSTNTWRNVYATTFNGKLKGSMLSITPNSSAQSQITEIPGAIRFDSVLVSNETSGFGSGHNNAILTIGRFSSTGYASQLGFSGNGKLYYRSFGNNTALDDSKVWSQIALTSDIPTTLKNPNKLTLTVGTNAAVEYDGSSTQSVTITPASIGAAASSHTHTQYAPTSHTHTKAQITDFPTSLKNPTKLTLTVGTNAAVEYDGSSAKSVSITAESLGLSKVFDYKGVTTTTLTDGSTTKPIVISNVSYTQKVGDVVIVNQDTDKEYFWNGTKWEEMGRTVDLSGYSPTSHTHSNASTSTAGFMSAADKSKLDGIATGANKYTHPSTHAASMITGLSTVATSGSYNDLSNKPTTLKNPNKLTLTVGTNSAVEYDGSASQSVSITPSTIGAAASSHSHTIDDLPIIPATKGGSGKTTLEASANAYLNALSTGSSNPTDNDYYISQYAGGGETTKTYHRRPVSALYNYIKGKLDSVYAAVSHTHSASSITSGTLAVSRGGTGLSTITSGHVIIGNGTNTPTTSKILSITNAEIDSICAQ